MLGRRSTSSLDEAEKPTTFPDVNKNWLSPRTTTQASSDGISKITNGPTVFERFSNFVANNHNAPSNDNQQLSTGERFKRDVAQRLGPNSSLEDEAKLQASFAARTAMYDPGRQHHNHDQGYSGLI
jgi:hypothetical protein